MVDESLKKGLTIKGQEHLSQVKAELRRGCAFERRHRGAALAVGEHLMVTDSTAVASLGYVRIDEDVTR